jgi:hypothetical protein
MARLPPLHPGFKDRRDGDIKPLDALLGVRRELPGEDRRQRHRRMVNKVIRHAAPPVLLVKDNGFYLSERALATANVTP